MRLVLKIDKSFGLATDIKNIVFGQPDIKQYWHQMLLENVEIATSATMYIPIK